MRTFARLAVASTAATYLLIFVGGLVRVSGAGLGCPDWPRCFGLWIPPVDAAQIPASIDPAHVNFTLLWIEYVNRLVGAVVVGPLVAATLVAAIWSCRRRPAILWTTVAAALLVIFQAWLGGRVVAMELEPLIVSIHLGFALVIVSMLLYVAHAAYGGLEPATAAADDPPRRLRRWFVALWAVAIVQVFFGAHLRGSLEALALDSPLFSDDELFARLGWWKYLHIGSGVALAALGCVAAVRARRRLGGSATARIAEVLAVLLLVQTGLGFAMGQLGLVPLLQVFHLWVASIAIGAAMLVVLELGRSPSEARVGAALVGAPGVAALASAAVLAVITVLVVSRAEASRTPPAGDTVPEFSARALDGGEVTDADLRGRLTILDMVSPGCAQCDERRRTLEELDWLHAHPERLQLVSISRESAPALAAAVSSDTDRGGEPGHPHALVLIDAGGRVRAAFDGADRESLRLLRETVRELGRGGEEVLTSTSADTEK